MPERGSAFQAARRLQCQFGTLGRGDCCPDEATAAIGAVRLCARHLEIVRAIASDSGLSREEVDAEVGVPSQAALVRKSRECERCHEAYQPGTQGRVSKLCPRCRAERDAPKPKPAKKPKPTPAKRPLRGRCECGTKFDIQPRGAIPTRCRDCQREWEREEKRRRERNRRVTQMEAA